MNIKKVEDLMKEAITHMESEFTKIRTGRANPSMLNDVVVEAYGNPSPISQVALISVPEAKQLLVKPFDPSLIKDIEVAINKKELGINPINDGEKIRINIPPLTEESRKVLTKEAKEVSENTKIAIRNIRKNANNDIKKSDELTDDQKSLLEEDVQKLTNNYNKVVEDKLKDKTEAIMTI